MDLYHDCLPSVVVNPFLYCHYGSNLVNSIEVEAFHLFNP
jgi:hypothetical protein